MNDNTNTIHFRKNEAGELISVSEFNTRITYTADRSFTIGRLEFSYTRTLVLKTLRARVRYTAYNNAVSRFYRSGFSHFQRLMRVLGFSVRMTY